MAESAPSVDAVPVSGSDQHASSANPVSPLNTAAASQHAQSPVSTTNRLTPTTKKIGEKFLTCPICFEMYSHPKCLPCLHTFCRHCLDSYIQSQDAFRARRKHGFPCPLCNQFYFIKSFEMPLSQWVEGIQNNFMVQNMIEYLLPQAVDQAENVCPLSVNPSPVRSSMSNQDNVPEDSGSLEVLPAGPNPDNGQHQEEDAEDSSTAAPSVLNPSMEPVALQNQHPSRYASRRSLIETGKSNDHVRHSFPYGAMALSYPTHDFYSEVKLQVNMNPLCNTKSHSSNDLNRHEMPAYYVDSDTMERVGLYRTSIDRQFSDVCCLSKANTIVITDYNNSHVLLWEGFFQGCKTYTKVKVDGKPTSVAPLDESLEDCVVVNLLNKGKIIFISIPELYFLRIIDTEVNVRSVAMLTTNTLLTGSSIRPARIDMVQVDNRFQVTRRHCLLENSQQCWAICTPNHMCGVTTDTFVVADTLQKSLVGYDIKTKNGRKVGEKSFSFTPLGDRKFVSLGGLCCHRSSGSIYVVDHDDNAVYRVHVGTTVRCEKVLCEKNGIRKPTSVCLSLRDELCVVDWQGRISVYKPKCVPKA
ncbi:uncharacterized protein [Haliotis cracherodii]|uniref:uncharacterized protein n=1 Tax=Haliotis cracherodii TaxID=6455 RepID=UPI0039E9AF1E